MKLRNINMNKYFHMIPLWKSPIKLPLELPVDFCKFEDPHGCRGPLWGSCAVHLAVELPVDFCKFEDPLNVNC